MRTKILLVAAAAMAAGMVASNAQVYSQNVVGYVNVVLPGNGAYSLLANPFDDGNGNSLTNILNPALPGGAAAVRSTLTYLSGGSPTTISKLGSGWAASPALPPGTGFYLRNGAPGGNAPSLTNTFVGSVVVLSAGSITNSIPTGFSLWGSIIPYAGNIANIGTPSGDANLNFGTIASISAGAGISKISYLSGGSLTTVNKSFATGNWAATVPVVPAQGFWLNNAGPATNMIQSATY